MVLSKTKRAIALLLAFFLSASMFTFSAVSAPTQQVQAAGENDSTLLVTLDKAKASQYQDYNGASASDEYNPNYGSHDIEVTTPIEPGAPYPTKSWAYDWAELYVYNSTSRDWDKVDEDNLFDEAAYEAAYEAADPQPEKDAVVNQSWVKPAFEFRFNAALYKGKKATIKYYNEARTKAAYGNYPSQVYGGYFGDIDDYADYKTPIKTFTLGAGSQSLKLTAAVYQTVKVTPGDSPVLPSDTEANHEADKYVDTQATAELTLKNSAGNVDYTRVDSLVLNNFKYDAASKRYVVYEQLFSNPKAGTYVFPAVKNQKLIYQATGDYKDGSKNSKGELKVAKPFQAKYLGGYTGDDVAGNPKTVKKVAANKSKSVGTIQLTKPTAKIKGTIVGNNYDYISANGVVKDQGVYVLSTERDYQRSNYNEWANYQVGNSKIEVDRELASNATEAEFLDSVIGTIVEVNIDSPYKIELNYDQYNALVEAGNGGLVEFTDSKYFQKGTVVDYATWDSLDGKLKESFYNYKIRDWVYYKLEQNYYKHTKVPATEAEYINYLTAAEVSDGGSDVYVVYPDVVEPDGSEFPTEVTKAVYDTLPDRLRYDDYDSTTKTHKYYQVHYSTYKKYTIAYDYWKPSTTYTVENLAAGVYFVEYGGQVKVVTVKAGKTYTANFKDSNSIKKANLPSTQTDVSGTKAKGKKLKAVAYITGSFKGSVKPSYKYYWTNGTKTLSKKAAIKLSKKTAKSNLWVLTVAKSGSYQEAYWTAAPGNNFGTVEFTVATTGTFKKGKKVKAQIVDPHVSSVKYKYQWLRNGKAIKKATKATYKLTKADKGKKISVKVTGKRDGYKTKTVKSSAKKAK